MIGNFSGKIERKYLILTLLPIIYVITPLFLSSLKSIKNFSHIVKILLAIFAVSQLIPSIFTPDPFVGILFGIIRVGFMVALIAYGSMIDLEKAVAYLSAGLLVACLIALFYSLLSGNLVSSRLQHPYMTSTTLGLAGVFLFWFSLQKYFKFRLRMVLISFSIIVIFLSGSRTALIVALISYLAALFLKSRQSILGILRQIFLIGLALMTLAWISVRYDAFSVSRMFDGTDSGRAAIWYTSLSTLEHFPLWGTGAYQLGKYISSEKGTCASFGTSDESQFCIQALQQLGQPWLIAHNTPLQQLVEFGPLGLMGMFLLIAVAFYGLVRDQSQMALIMFIGLLLFSLFDNVFLLPSPFFGEFFWLIVGKGLSTIEDFNAEALLSFFTILLITFSPILYFVRPISKDIIEFTALSRKDNRIYYAINAKGSYQIGVFDCNSVCRPISVKQVSIVNPSEVKRRDFKVDCGDCRKLRLVVFNTTQPTAILDSQEIVESSK